MARPAARRPPSVPGRWRRRCGAVAQPTRRSAARWVAPPSGRASPPRWVRSAAVEPCPPTLTPTLALTLTPPHPQPEPTLPGEQWGGGEGGGEGGGGEGGPGGTAVSSERVARMTASAMQAMLGNTFAEEEGRTDASTPHRARTLGEQRAPARPAPHGLLLSNPWLAEGPSQVCSPRPAALMPEPRLGQSTAPSSCSARWKPSRARARRAWSCCAETSETSPSPTTSPGSSPR